MKKLLIIFIIILSGCVSSNNTKKISLDERQKNNDIQSCKYYGYEEESIDFSNCLMKLDTAHCF